MLNATLFPIQRAYPLTRVHATTVRGGINPQLRKRQHLSNAQLGKELVRDCAAMILARRNQRPRPVRADAGPHVRQRAPLATLIVADDRRGYSARATS